MRHRLDDRLDAALAEAEPTPFWLDSAMRPPARPSLAGEIEADLPVVGGGLTGLWTALQAKEEAPGREVVLLEGEYVSFGATGRNGGFVDSSLTHGLQNGLERFRHELRRLDQFGRENLAAIEETLVRHGIDAGYEQNGLLDVATRQHEVMGLAEAAELLQRYGWDAEVLGREVVRAELDSPTYLGGIRRREGVALVDPAQLAWGDSRVRPRAWVCASTRARRPSESAGTVKACASPLARAASAPESACSRRPRSRRSYMRSSAMSSRSTTTCSSRSR